MPGSRLKLVPNELNFDTVNAARVPRDRKSKHNQLMTRILEDLQRISPAVALRIPRSALGSQKVANVRAALAREIKKTELVIGTSIDDDYFYVWLKKS
jgi:hypothetical protein